MNSFNRLAYNAINKMQSSKAGQEGKKELLMYKKKKKKYFLGIIHTNAEVEINYTKSIGVKSMGKAYKARPAEGYYVQFLEILYYVYIYIFPRLTNRLIYLKLKFSSSNIFPASILPKSTSGRHRPVSYPDGPMTARYRFT